jgi:HPt (histidine-containing phosphotransfer) domain-containing protein
VTAEVPLTDRDYVDWTTALENVNGNQELLVEVVQLFLDDSSRMLNLIRQSIGDGDADSLQQTAHALKGAMLFLGETRASVEAQSLENIGHSGDLDDAKRTLENLVRQMDLMGTDLSLYLRNKA